MKMYFVYLIFSEFEMLNDKKDGNEDFRKRKDDLA